MNFQQINFTGMSHYWHWPGTGSSAYCRICIIGVSTKSIVRSFALAKQISTHELRGAIWCAINNRRKCNTRSPVREGRRNKKCARCGVICAVVRRKRFIIIWWFQVKSITTLVLLGVNRCLCQHNFQTPQISAAWWDIWRMHKCTRRWTTRSLAAACSLSSYLYY
jgi:hypothetical protein